MKISDFDYNLPKGLIAQYPCKERDESRLLVLDRNRGTIEHRIFKDIVEYFHKGDLLVLNDTKVVPARLRGKKETGGRVEVLILDARRSECEVLLKPARGCKLGSRLLFGNGELEAEVVKIENGRRFLKFECNGDFEKLLDRVGEVPLPPYIKRNAEDIDKKRYQTIYACKKGAVAAPTAGLHFTKDILSSVSSKGVDIEYITLHVGYGTFRPVKCDNITKHRMVKEYFEAKRKVIEKLKTREGKTVGVGTTTCRVLETIFSSDERRETSDETGWTDLFIYPGYRFKAVDALLTNFHLPRTTLLMLVTAFCGREMLLRAYQEAIEKGYRFYSYGDSMLII